jgi:hypothetical protein
MERILSYNESEYGKKYVMSKFYGDSVRQYATWFLGNNYQNTSTYYGAYPPMYWKRIQAFVKPNDKIVHLFSGSLEKGDYIRVDMNPDMNPDVICKSEDVDKHIQHDSIDVVFADPPYTQADSNIGYKGNFPNKKKTLHSIHKILKKDGIVIWLDTCLPMFRKTEYKLIAVITIIISTNHRVRLVSVFQKV